VIDLAGLRAGPGQVWGGVRLVPLLREEPVDGLRLYARAYEPDGPSTVALPDRTYYTSYIPHAFVAELSSVSFGSRLGTADDIERATVDLKIGRKLVRRVSRRRKGVQRDRVRFLPLHLALEGYLALHFGGPSIVWEEWSERAIRRGLSPREEAACLGTSIPGLEDALRVFEIYPGQCGMVLYVADAVAGAFVVPHPEDYRALHSTLIQDLYGELIFHYAMYAPAVQDFAPRLQTVGSLAELRTAVDTACREWEEFHAGMAGGLLAGEHTFQEAYRIGRFTLSRFLPVFHPKTENHIGETITDADGRLAYLKTFRLSEAQVHRGHLLSRLAANDWSIPATAEEFGTDTASFGVRLDRAGFGHLLQQHILDHYRSRTRRSTR
jgi:hypothetical protein